MIVQILIAVLGIAAVWLSQDERYERRRYACIFGLIGQPLWLYTTWTASQWGIFILSIVYTFAWLKGFQLYWLNKEHCLAKDNVVWRKNTTMIKTFASPKSGSAETVEEIIRFLKEQNRVLTIAESCTAGEVCSLIADVSGCGSVLFNGYVVYTELAKQECLGVRAETIEKFGLTSEEVAREMALGALNNHKPMAHRNLGTGRPNMSLAITGTAESDDEQDGVVCFAYAALYDDEISVFTETVKFAAPRNEVRRKAAEHAILTLPDFCRNLRKLASD